MAMHGLYWGMMFGSMLYLMAAVWPDFNIQKARGILFGLPVLSFVLLFGSGVIINNLEKNSDNDRNDEWRTDFKIAVPVFAATVALSFYLTP
jgi:hypothetical protein